MSKRSRLSLYFDPTRVWFLQKLAVITFFIVTNTLLCIIAVVFNDYWYIFLSFLYLASFINILSLAMIGLAVSRNSVAKALETQEPAPKKLAPVNLLLMIPCYNENFDELSKTVNSYLEQKYIEQHNVMLVVIADGKIKGKGEELSTDQILVQQVFKDKITGSAYLPRAYQDWHHNYLDVEVHTGKIKHIKFMVIIKQRNVGKRDSITIVRRLCSLYSNHSTQHDHISRLFLSAFAAFIAVPHIDYKIGTDADTYLENTCVNYLLTDIVADPSVYGIAGMVRVSPDCPRWNFWSLYQGAEYINGQCIRRLQQSVVNGKVDCLPGCVQIIPIKPETCGEELLNKYNRYPLSSENVFKQVIAAASEDSHHTTMMLYTYPYTKTRLCMKANAFTIVPLSWSVFLSQRKRWSVGGTTNTLLACFQKNVDVFERTVMCVEVLVFAICPFVVFTIGILIWAIVVHPTWMLLYLSVIPLIPIVYSYLITAWLPLPNKEKVDFIVGFSMYVVVGQFINCIVVTYSLWNMDDFKWGKTREVAAETPEDAPSIPNPAFNPATLPLPEIIIEK